MYRVKRVGFVLLGLGLLPGCRTAHDVAVSSFRVLDAPANYVRRHIDGETHSTTATTATSDTVTTPGRTVSPTTETNRRTTTQTQSRANTEPNTVTERTKPSPSPSRTATTQAQIPT